MLHYYAKYYLITVTMVTLFTIIVSHIITSTKRMLADKNSKLITYLLSKHVKTRPFLSKMIAFQ